MIAVSALRNAELLHCYIIHYVCFSSETAISFVTRVMCIIYYLFRNILKNLFESLNQSIVSMIIAQSSKDVELGGHYFRSKTSAFFLCIFKSIRNGENVVNIVYVESTNGCPYQFFWYFQTKCFRQKTWHPPSMYPNFSEEIIVFKTTKVPL